MSVQETDPATGAAATPLPPAAPLEFGDAGPAMMLADHLDATLAMAEDLSRLTLRKAGNAATGPGSTALIELAQQARALELGMTARLLQARKRAQDLDARHEDVRRLIGSFIGGTAILADAAASDGDGFGDTTLLALASGSAALAFLKSRGSVADNVAVIDDVGTITIGEDYHAAGMIHLGSLMDMLAAFLDALDLAFELYSPANRPN